ncbi:ATP-grasp domain-containing protein [Chengkuizengella axinellae]|uniref:ATP-grasp domain-containing protein n=1 Tax=Chengkuizengella axinellae TaxID=3064388 RepID=A0ABT9IZP8_9BACL|nr:ATP-grasp domain-containing protein [Chengkuizengella sp. 2205SS18-9]MDP5274851.1 ATP-grasp domain-containing protein [Chengkuizengella sp. 2205SS18-9]
MDKLIVILGPSEYGVLAAIKLGFKCIVISPRSSEIPNVVSERVDSIILVNSLEDTDEIHQKLIDITKRYTKIDLVTSFTEMGLESAAILSEQLGLPTNQCKVVKSTRDKSRMREIFSDNHLLKLNYKLGYIHEFEKNILPIPVPFIIKPFDGVGSKNIFFIDNQEKWTEWFLKHSNKDYNKWIFEPFIEGPEYSVEIVSSNGDHFILGITEKTTSENPHFIEIGHTTPAAISQELYENIVHITKEALTTIGVEYGPSHIEVKRNIKDNKIVVIEMHTRPGGDYIPYLHNLSTGFDQYELGIKSHYDSSVLKLQIPQHTQCTSIKFLSFEEGTLLSKGFLDEITDDNIHQWSIYYNVGDKIKKAVDSHTRAGHVIVKSNSKKLNEQSIVFFEDNLDIKLKK